MHFYFKFIFLNLFFPFFLISRVFSANFFVSLEDIMQMKQAGLNGKIIDLYSSEQTCSVTPSLLIQLHKSGADDVFLEKVIKDDLYTNIMNSEFIDNQNNIFKLYSFSEVSDVNFISNTGIFVEGDNQGNEIVIYKSRSNFDDDSNKDTNNQFFIFIEKVINN